MPRVRKTWEILCIGKKFEMGVRLYITGVEMDLGELALRLDTGS